MTDKSESRELENVVRQLNREVDRLKHEINADNESSDQQARRKLPLISTLNEDWFQWILNSGYRK